jgi:Ca-activated chloride channel family protein
MIGLEWPWLLLLLPAPLLARSLLPATSQTSVAALRTPFVHEITRSNTTLTQPPARSWPLWLGLLAWALLLLASSRPQWLGDPIALPVSGRDLMLAMDISGSMQEQDFTLRGQRVTRIEATKAVANEFIQQREGDRIGLILFGDQAYLQAPLTFDRTTVQTLMQEAAIGLAGKKTAIGDAIGLGIKRMQGDDPNRVMVLLTDGANTAGEIDPVVAAGIAAEAGLKIYTIGIGADEMLVGGIFGTRRVNPSRDLDEETLETIATVTGGRFFRAHDTGELQQIYQLLDTLEPVEKGHSVFRPAIALYPWPLGVSIAVCLLILSLRSHRKPL